MNIKFNDKAPIGMVRDTADGYLVAMSRVARTGVQEYRASELGLVGDHVVKVMRGEKHVFAKDAVSSLSHAPITVDHPPIMVDASNWKDLAVGEVGDGVLRDGEWLSVPLILKDAAGIAAARDTHKEISMGYTANLVDAPDGADYDLEMTDIKFNHLAIVPRGRAGSEARIGDAHKWGAAPQPQKEAIQMDMKTIVVGDKAVQVALSDADVVNAVIDGLKQEITDRDAAIGEHMATIKNLEAKQLTDADVEAKAVERAAVIDRAHKFVADMDTKGKSVDAIRREALASMFDAAKVADFPEAAVATMFDTLEPAKVDDSAREALKSQDKTKVADGNINWAAIQKKGAK